MKSMIKAAMYAMVGVVGIILLAAECDSTLSLIASKVIGIALCALTGWAYKSGKFDCLKKYFTNE